MKQPVIVRNTRIGDGIPKICVPIVEKDFPSILYSRQELKVILSGSCRMALRSL